MDKKLLWKGFHEILDKDWVSLKMKLCWSPNYNIEILLDFWAIALKERRKC